MRGDLVNVYLKTMMMTSLIRKNINGELKKSAFTILYKYICKKKNM